jgi:hypothetical protein
MVPQRKVGVVGAGFYGTYCAIRLQELGFEVTLFESGKTIFQGASTLNQARVHNGYHYPRSLQTASRSAENYLRFKNDFSEAIVDNFNSYYLIAHGSKVSSAKFLRFCQQIGVSIQYANSDIESRFNATLIEGAFRVEECSFDARKLCSIMESRSKNIAKLFNSEILYAAPSNSDPDNKNQLWNISTKDNTWTFDFVVDATYGSLDYFENVRNKMYEVCELVLIDSNDEIDHLAFTVMDGPFWSLTPWPAMQSHVLTHVRHTPHARFSDRRSAIDYLKVAEEHPRATMMVRDMSRYFTKKPDIKVKESKFVIKTIPTGRDFDDGRPIKFLRKNSFLSILGSKIDNVYDLDTLLFDLIGVEK